MNGEAQIFQTDQPVINVPGIEKQLILEQKASATNDLKIVSTTTGLPKIEDRFARLKKNLRKRSASIL